MCNIINYFCILSGRLGYPEDNLIKKKEKKEALISPWNILLSLFRYEYVLSPACRPYAENVMRHVA